MNLFQLAFDQSQAAAEHGFDWPDTTPVAHKVMEEAAELLAAVEEQHVDNIRHEVGDVLLALVSLARHQHIDLQSCFQQAIERFDRRWSTMLELHDNHTALTDLTPDDWELLWQQAKEQLDMP